MNTMTATINEKLLAAIFGTAGADKEVQAVHLFDRGRAVRFARAAQAAVPKDSEGFAVEWLPAVTRHGHEARAIAECDGVVFIAIPDDVLEVADVRPTDEGDDLIQVS